MSNLEDRRDSPRRPIRPAREIDWDVVLLIAFGVAVLILAVFPENGAVP